MTRRTNGTVAGIAFLVYIAAAMSGLILSSRAASGEGTAAKLASIAAHASQFRAAIVLELVGCFCALVLAVTLYAITRDQDRDLALLALTFRVAEGVIGGVAMQREAQTLWIATATGTGAPDPAAATALGAYLVRLPTLSGILGATFFAVGSTLFAWLFLRGRIVPVWLARLGVFASVLILVILPLELVGIARGLVTQVMWLPALVYELTLAVWLIGKGAAIPARRPGA